MHFFSIDYKKFIYLKGEFKMAVFEKYKKSSLLGKMKK